MGTDERVSVSGRLCVVVVLFIFICVGSIDSPSVERIIHNLPIKTLSKEYSCSQKAITELLCQSQFRAGVCGTIRASGGMRDTVWTQLASLKAGLKLS